jgi:hypothetical protein
MKDHDFDAATKNVRPLMNEFFELHKRERAKRDGEWWFVHPELAHLADEIAKWFEAYMWTYRRTAERFRTGRN